MNLKRIVEILPLIVGFLIFNGFLKLYIYYGYWEINIIQFLDFSEILLSFLNDLSIIILCVVIFLFYQLIITKLFIKKIDPESFIDSIEKHKKRFLLLCFILLAITTLLFLHSNSIIWLFISMAFIFQFLYFLFEFSLKENENIILSLAIIGTFLSFTICLGYYDIEKTKKNAFATSIKIKIDNEILTTSNTFYLLGKSQNFFYLFNSKTNSSRIVPTSRIQNFEIHKIK